MVRVKVGGDDGETGEPTGHHEDFGSLKRFKLRVRGKRERQVQVRVQGLVWRQCLAKGRPASSETQHQAGCQDGGYQEKQLFQFSHILAPLSP